MSTRARTPSSMSSKGSAAAPSSSCSPGLRGPGAHVHYRTHPSTHAHPPCRISIACSINKRTNLCTRTSIAFDTRLVLCATKGGGGLRQPSAPGHLRTSPPAPLLLSHRFPEPFGISARQPRLPFGLAKKKKLLALRLALRKLGRAGQLPCMGRRRVLRGP